MMNTWVCEKCGWNNPGQVAVCIVCGTKNEPQNPSGLTSHPLTQAAAHPGINKLALASFGLSLVIILIFFVQRILAQSLGNNAPTSFQQMLFDSFCFIPSLSAMGSIATGIVALRQISYEKEKGAWMARFGIVVGIMQFLLIILMFLATVLIS